jgi:1-acyl-sn-glycerol-3-phosphate acyltransferase
MPATQRFTEAPAAALDAVPQPLLDLAAGFRDSAVRQVLDRLTRLHRREPFAELAVSGGAAANRLLRRRLPDWAAERGVALRLVPLVYSGDNAAMIAFAAVARLERGESDDPLVAEAASRLHARRMKQRVFIDLLWLPVNALQLLATWLWSAFWISVALLVAAVGRRRGPALWLARHVWAPGMIAIGLSRLRVVGRERLDLGRSCFFVANHQSWLDIPVLFAAVPAPLHFIAKQELARVPFLGWYIAAMGMVFVDRSARRKALASVSAAGELLAGGGSLVSFPEGTRSAPGELGRFKAGGFAAVLDTPALAVDVVPVGIVGAGKDSAARRFQGPAGPGRGAFRRTDPGDRPRSSPTAAHSRGEPRMPSRRCWACRSARLPPPPRRPRTPQRPKEGRSKIGRHGG